MLAAATETGSSLNAIYPALAAIIVAIIGVAGNIVLARRKRPTDDDDTNVITALASALAAETERANDATRRAEQCEAREQSRRR